jgi:hypothetical protein
LAQADRIQLLCVQNKKIARDRLPALSGTADEILMDCIEAKALQDTPVRKAAVHIEFKDDRFPIQLGIYHETRNRNTQKDLKDYY